MALRNRTGVGVAGFKRWRYKVGFDHEERSSRRDCTCWLCREMIAPAKPWGPTETMVHAHCKHCRGEVFQRHGSLMHRMEKAEQP